MKKFNKRIEKAADFLKILGNPVRICILNCLMNSTCNVSGIQRCLDLPQPTVSQHLSILKSADIIGSERRGSEIIYFLTDERVKDIIKLLILESDKDVCYESGASNGSLS